MFKNFEKWKPLVAKQVAIKIFEVQEKESFKHEREVLRSLRNESGVVSMCSVDDFLFKMNKLHPAL